MTTFTTDDRIEAEIDWKAKYESLQEEYEELQRLFDVALHNWAKDSERDHK
jgi:hypothetical protein